MLWRVTVQRENSAKPLGFDPVQRQAQYNTATGNGDAVFWFNEDKHASHHPVPETGTWNIGEIGPETSSDQLQLNAVGSFKYKCALHEDEPAAEILVANPVLIAAGADPLFGGALAISKGQCVSWGNADENPHQPCPDSGDPWFTEPIASGDLSAPITINDSVTYHCALHPSETGTIDVT